MVNIIATELRMVFGERLLFAVPRLAFREGDAIHLQGDNGSGKTTLMKLLAGLLEPTAGHIRAEGFAALPWWRKPSLLGKALYLHQHPYLFEGSVNYNLRLVQRYSQLPQAQQQLRLASAIELAQLDSLLNADATTLSGGERQRVALARAWILKPPLLMLDEPTSNMDKDSRQLVTTMIAELRKQGTGLLISSHQEVELTQICRQQWLIDAQQIHCSTIE